MGQKVHPYGFRLGFNKPWRSRWFAKQGYSKLLKEDLELKEALRERLKSAGVSSIEVDRPGNKLRVTIRTSRPGIIIGRKGAEIEKLKQDLAKKTKREVFIDIQEVHKPELDAQLVSESIALQLEKRVAFRRAMRKAVDSALRFGCKGIKVRVGENSPNLCPTMFSVRYTGINFLPLWTATVWPTNSGRIVERRDQVRTTFFSLATFNAVSLASR